MTFRDDNGNTIDFNGEFAITKQAVSVFNGKINGDVSLNFEIENNSVNRKVLNYFGPNMKTQVAFTKQAFNRIDEDGNYLDRGYIVIQSEEGSKLNCFYTSGNSNWVQLLTGLITNLDFSGYRTLINKDTVIGSISIGATTGMIFPSVDWCFDNRKGHEVYFTMRGATKRVVDTRNDADSYTLFEFYPCFYLRTLVQEIFTQNSLKIAGTVLNDPLYQSMIITPRNGQMKRPPFKDMTVIGGSSDVIPITTLQKYIYWTTAYASYEASDPDNLFDNVNNTYTANITGLLYFYMKNTAYFKDAPSTPSVKLYQNGVQVQSINIPSPIVGSIQPGDTVRFTQLANKGDVFEIYINTDTANSYFVYTMTVSSPKMVGVNDYVTPDMFLPALNCMDVVKFIINYFGCAVYYDEHSKTVTVNIIEEIKPENAQDWSEYYISHRNEYTVDQATNNYARWDDNKLNSSIKIYNETHKVKFGEGTIITQNTLKTDREFLKFPFNPSPTLLSKNQFIQASVPLIKLVDDGSSSTYTAKANLGSNVTRFTVPDSSLFHSQEIIRLVNSNGSDLGFFLIDSISSGTTIDLFYTFDATGTGTIWRQNINYQEIGPTILTVKPSTNFVDFSMVSTITVMDESGTTSIGKLPFATFTKSTFGKNIDFWKGNLAVDNPDSGGFIDPTSKTLFLNKINKFLNNPNVRAQMMLPKAIMKNFDFSSFITIKTKDLTGYFFVESIVNYKNSNTPVEVNLLML